MLNPYLFNPAVETITDTQRDINKNIWYWQNTIFFRPSQFSSTFSMTWPITMYYTNNRLIIDRVKR